MSQERRNPRGHDFYMDVWHRKNNLKRFIDRQRAAWMSQIDIDACEYCNLCGQPVAVIETKDITETCKATTVTEKLAERAQLPVFLVEYQLAHPIERCVSCGRPDEVHGQDIVQFWVTDLSVGERLLKLPTDYAEWLWSLRERHWKFECQNGAATKMLHYPSIEMAAVEAENRALKYVIEQREQGTA
jgi:ferredoxin